MAFRNIIVENGAFISLKNEQLVIRSDCEHSVPIEDISALLLESHQITITTAALSRLGQCGCTVFTCDEKHLPCAVMLPFCQHSRALTVLQSQIDLSEPTKKRLWQSIVKQKINNQALCLRIVDQTNEANYLESLKKRVQSGDGENIEAIAAQYYFPALFGGDFAREIENGINAGLNYGYSILRGCIARNLATYGFMPSYGLHHKNALNAFNLADDLIEPFRPIIDLLVFKNMSADSVLTPKEKRLLFNCLNLDVLSGTQHHSVSYAIERMVQSLGRAFDNREKPLVLPTLVDTKQHQYE